MTVQCMGPDAELGVALRLASYLDCQSRALGENGFQALTGGPGMAAILSGVATIFIALIGYRLILGTTPALRDGVGWALRLGIVFALVTSWPAFQVLVYRVVTDGPPELAAVILPAAGLPSESLDDRIQGAYDVIRVGTQQRSSMAMTTMPAAVNPPQPPVAGMPPGAQMIPPSSQIPSGVPPLPQTASLLVVSTSGIIAALRIVVGFLIAIGPVAILCLLFNGTMSVFEGWIRALVGAAFGVLAATITTAIELVSVEGELAHAQAARIGADAASSLDPQALVTIILFFTIVALAAVYAALRVASAFRLPVAAGAFRSSRSEAFERFGTSGDIYGKAGAPRSSPPTLAPERARADAIADALTTAAYRDQEMLGGRNAAEGYSRPMTIRQESGGVTAVPATPLGVAGRRMTARRTQRAQRRDVQA